MNMLLKRKFMAGLSLFAAAGSLVMTSVQAQDASDTKEDGPVKLEKFTVTGSNIPTAADALAIPVVTIGAQEIANTGVNTDVLDVLRKAMPQFSGNGNIGSENANIGSGTTYGGSSLSLHNLSTLVLINGRRVAFSPATASGGGEFVDVNMIPLAAIQSIETLSDGASAIYGSDAVSGVVNIILKSNYEGFEVGGHYGVTNNTGHYSERSAYLVGGTSNGTTSITISAQYSQQDPIFQFQRPFSADQTGKTTYFPGVIDIYDFATGDNPYYMLAPGVNAPPGGGIYSIQDLIDQGVYVQKTEDEVANSFNLAKYVTLVMQQKRRSATVSFDHKMFGGKVTGFGDLMFSNTNSQSQINGQPIYPFVSTPYMDYELTGETPAPAAGIGTGWIASSAASNPFSPAFINQGQDYPNNYDETTGQWVTVHNRFIDHPRVYQNDTTLMRGVGGLRGQINENYSWEVAANLNRITLDYHNPGVINVNSFTDALNSGAINPFAIVQDSPIASNIIGAAQASFLSTLNSFDAKINGTPLTLPAGDLAFALGGQYSRESFAAVPDALSIPDANDNIGWAGATSLSPFNAARKITAGFIEVQAPLVSPQMSVPAVHRLDFDVAGRIESYSDVGTAKVPKFSGRYQPFDDQLTLRGTVGESFTAPQLYYVYGPVSSGFTQSLQFNTYAGGVSTKKQFQSRSGSNRDLQPAKAHSWTAGFVYTPKQVRGLKVSFDFYEINETGLLGNFDAAVVAQDVELKGAASPYAQYVHVGGWDGPTISTPGQLNTLAASNVYMDLPIVNLAGQKVRGFDATVDYVLNTDSAGKFDFASTAVVYNSYRVKALPTERYYQYAGYATEGGTGSNGTLAKWRTYTTVNWSFRGLELLLANTYIPSVTDIGPGGSAPQAPLKVDSFTSFDFAASYNIKSSWLKNLKVTLGVNNIFNEMPPLAPNAFTDANADIGTYGAIGRFFYVDASYKF